MSAETHLLLFGLELVESSDPDAEEDGGSEYRFVPSSELIDSMHQHKDKITQRDGKIFDDILAQRYVFDIRYPDAENNEWMASAATLALFHDYIVRSNDDTWISFLDNAVNTKRRVPFKWIIVCDNTDCIVDNDDTKKESKIQLCIGYIVLISDSLNDFTAVLTEQSAVEEPKIRIFCKTSESDILP